MGSLNASAGGLFGENIRPAGSFSTVLNERNPLKPLLKSGGQVAMGQGKSAALARIEAVADPDDAQWVRSLVEAIDPKGQRDAAIREAAALLGGSAPSAKAKELAMELQRYLSTAWLRERDLSSPPADASPLRRELHRIARLMDGSGLGWRRLVEIIET
jgi:hypothetical protein